MHRDFFAQYAADQGARGLRDATAAPRSFAKTTVLGKIKILHDCVYQHERYIVIISSREELAVDKVKDVRTELETNAALHRVYGPQVGDDTWNMGDFITAPGVRVRAAARGSQVRGLLWGNVRPSKVLLDDSENSDHVLTEMQRQKTWNWFAEDITKLGDEHTNIEVIGTLLHDDSLLAKLLHNPGYRQRRYAAVLSFATAAAIPLWQQWRARFLDLDNPDHIADARAFFEAQAPAMLEGSAVLWPEGYDYYTLMVERLVDGDAAFFKERQNLPQQAGDRLFDLDRAGFFRLTSDRILRQDGRVVLFHDLTDIVAGWDPAIGQGDNPDWSACVVLATDALGYMYLLDGYLSQGEAPATQVAGVVEVALRWGVRRFGFEANMFASLLRGDLEQAFAQQAQGSGQSMPLLVPITNTRNKALRISTLQNPLVHRHLWLAETLPAELYRQFTVYRPIDGADHDDGPDAVELAMRVLRHVGT